MTLRWHRLFSSVLSPALVLIALGCGGPPELPPLDTLYVDKPGADSGSSSMSQPLCAADFDVSGLDYWIEAINSGIEDQILLIEALQSATARRTGNDGEWEWVVEEGGASLSLTAVESADGVDYSATYSGPIIAEYHFMDGSLSADGSAGGWSFYGLGGAEIIEVSFTTDGEDLEVQRTNLLTTVEADYSLIGTTFSFNIAGPRNSATASWDTLTYDGSFQANDNAPLCWDYMSSGDFCETDC